MYRVWGFGCPKIKSTIWGVPIKRIIVLWGFYIGSPFMETAKSAVLRLLETRTLTKHSTRPAWKDNAKCAPGFLTLRSSAFDVLKQAEVNTHSCAHAPDLTCWRAIIISIPFPYFPPPSPYQIHWPHFPLSTSRVSLIILNPEP